MKGTKKSEASRGRCFCIMLSCVKDKKSLHLLGQIDQGDHGTNDSCSLLQRERAFVLPRFGLFSPANQSILYLLKNLFCRREELQRTWTAQEILPGTTQNKFLLHHLILRQIKILIAKNVQKHLCMLIYSCKLIMR